MFEACAICAKQDIASSPYIILSTSPRCPARRLNDYSEGVVNFILSLLAYRNCAAGGASDGFRTAE